MSVTSVRIEDDLDKPLAPEVKTSREYLAHRQLAKQRWQDTIEALEDIRMGRVVDGDKVHAWLDSWGTDNEDAMPTK